MDAYDVSETVAPGTPPLGAHRGLTYVWVGPHLIGLHYIYMHYICIT